MWACSRPPARAGRGCGGGEGGGRVVSRSSLGAPAAAAALPPTHRVDVGDGAQAHPAQRVGEDGRRAKLEHFFVVVDHAHLAGDGHALAVFRAHGAKKRQRRLRRAPEAAVQQVRGDEHAGAAFAGLRARGRGRGRGVAARRGRGGAGRLRLRRASAAPCSECRRRFPGARRARCARRRKSAARLRACTGCGPQRGSARRGRKSRRRRTSAPRRGCRCGSGRRAASRKSAAPAPAGCGTGLRRPRSGSPWR